MRLAYDDPGTGEPAVVLIHGWGFGNPSALVPQFEHLAKRRRVLKLDLPGHGRRVVGSGHWMTLVVPGQVNAMLDRFLEIVLVP